jgi:hypothetical protein
LEITVSFLEIQKWEPDIYIGFSRALHLQCRGKRKRRNMMHASERRMRGEMRKERRERAEEEGVIAKRKIKEGVVKEFS